MLINLSSTSAVVNSLTRQNQSIQSLMCQDTNKIVKELCNSTFIFNSEKNLHASIV